MKKEERDEMSNYTNKWLFQTFFRQDLNIEDIFDERNKGQTQRGTFH